jgi:hypothetical protein
MLDVQYAVGRLDFDTPEEYKRYVDSVIRYEEGATVPNSREVVFFGTRHSNDAPTKLSSETLVKPLAAGGAEGDLFDNIQQKCGTTYQPRRLEPEQSTKASLSEVFGAAAKPTPALLFTASHGLGWPLGDARQVPATGALLCQDYIAPGLGPLGPEHYFAAADLAPNARVHGLVCFLFACYGGGTPEFNRFVHAPEKAPPKIADKPFMSALPKALLTHPNGGALGVFGHVERAWVHSIVSVGAGPQLMPFENLLGYVLSGLPLGYALKDFNERYAALSTGVSALLERKSFNLPVSDSELARCWVERNDAESYMLFGDPGVRVRVDKLAGAPG